MEERVFLVEVAPEGGFTARALGVPIFTEADDRETLRQFILDAVKCHYEPEERPRMLRLHCERRSHVPLLFSSRH